MNFWFFTDLDLDLYNSLTEEVAVEILKRHTFTDDEFQDICQRMMSETGEATPSDGTL